jgi:hypothetical protein
MIVSVNQPAYLPWLGYFHRIAASDVHVVLDHVQFEKGSFVNRNRVRTAGGAAWLTVPVRTSGRLGGLPIAEVEIAGDDWRRKHRRTLREAYARAPHLDEHEPFFASVYDRPWRLLADLCAETTSYLLRSLGIGTPIVRSSELAPAGAKDELVLDLCRRLGAATYLSGALGRQYLREELFAEAGIQVVYQDYRHPVYAQLHEPFLPFMAAVDLLFTHGPATLDVLLAEQTPVAAG